MHLATTGVKGQSGYLMDFRELQEIERVLINHEEHIHCNRSSFFIVTSKLHEIECWFMSHIAEIMGSIVELKQQLVV